MPSQRGHSFPHSFIPVFIQEIFTERLLSARCCSKYQDAARNQTDRNRPRGQHCGAHTQTHWETETWPEPQQLGPAREKPGGQARVDSQGVRGRRRQRGRGRDRDINAESETERHRETEALGVREAADNHPMWSVMGPSMDLGPPSSCHLWCLKPVPSALCASVSPPVSGTCVIRLLRHWVRHFSSVRLRGARVPFGSNPPNSAPSTP